VRDGGIGMRGQNKGEEKNEEMMIKRYVAAFMAARKEAL
jgi:hypothetical protein